MFDTMKMVKSFGWLCGALLIYLLINWMSDEIYAMDTEGETQGYLIEVASADDGDAPAEDTGPSFAEVFETADAAKGEKTFGKCKGCHRIDGKNNAGPHLDGVVGRPVASVGDFPYSDEMKATGGDWTPEHLNAFLTNPKEVVPGTAMQFRGLRTIEERANLIAYLQGL